MDGPHMGVGTRERAGGSAEGLDDNGFVFMFCWPCAGCVTGKRGGGGTHDELGYEAHMAPKGCMEAG